MYTTPTLPSLHVALDIGVTADVLQGSKALLPKEESGVSEDGRNPLSLKSPRWKKRDMAISCCQLSWSGELVKKSKVGMRLRSSLEKNLKVGVYFQLCRGSRIRPSVDTQKTDHRRVFEAMSTVNKSNAFSDTFESAILGLTRRVNSRLVVESGRHRT